MIGTIRKHSKVLWAVIITVVIITFVFWGAKTGNQANQREVDFGILAGKPIKREDFAKAYREVNLLYFFSAGDWPKESAKDMGFDVNRETYIRLLMLQKVKEAGIHVSDETVARVAAELLRSFSRGQPVSMELFERNVLNRGGLTAMDFERYIRNMLGIQQLISIHGLAGRLVTPQEIRLLYERENEEIATEAVFFAATNYLSEVQVTPDAIQQFYTNQMARYRVPERVQVAYVAYEITNFASAAEAELVKTNFDEIIEARVRQVGTNFYHEATTPEQIRAKAREELIRLKATMIARQKANEFANVVDGLSPKNVASFEKAAESQKLAVKVTSAFGRQDGPIEFVVPEDFTRDAFNRTEEEPFSAALVGQDAVYVIALKDRLPSQVPPLERVRTQVEADYKQTQAAAAARRAGTAFAATLTNGLAAGKTFSSLCVEAKVHPEIVPPLALSTRSLPAVEAHVSLQQYKSVVFTASVGQATQFVPTMNGGFVAFVREKLPIQPSKMTADLPEFTRMVRQTRQGEAYNDWFRREAERGMRGIPMMQRPSNPGSMPQ